VSLEGTSTLRVRYAETDQMGVAWHGNFLAWFEVGRTDLLRGRGASYRDLEGDDLRLPVIETGVRYLRPARYDDVLEIRTRLDQVGGARIRFAYSVHRPPETAPLAEGFTTHAAVDGRGHPRRLPAGLRGLLR